MRPVLSSQAKMVMYDLTALRLVNRYQGNIPRKTIDPIISRMNRCERTLFLRCIDYAKYLLKLGGNVLKVQIEQCRKRLDSLI